MYREALSPGDKHPAVKVTFTFTLTVSCKADDSTQTSTVYDSPTIAVYTYTTYQP
jgi:hypothetical protein